MINQNWKRGVHVHDYTQLINIIMKERTMNYDFELTILGSPISQGRPKARNAGKFVQIYDDPKSKQAKFSIQCVIQDKAPE